MASRKPHPISTSRRVELMKPALREEVRNCQACVPDTGHAGCVLLCPDHLIKDVFDRL
jgi:hypothetical protein